MRLARAGGVRLHQGLEPRGVFVLRRGGALGGRLHAGGRGHRGKLERDRHRRRADRPAPTAPVRCTSSRRWAGRGRSRRTSRRPTHTSWTPSALRWRSRPTARRWSSSRPASRRARPASTVTRPTEAPIKRARSMSSRASARAWSQQAYVKASNAQADDSFGGSVRALRRRRHAGRRRIGRRTRARPASTDRDRRECRELRRRLRLHAQGGTWSQQAYVKASNPGLSNFFGIVALSGDGATLAVGAPTESSAATGIDGNQADQSALNSGAVYVFARDGADLVTAGVRQGVQRRSGRPVRS